ncbi:hypothetical protein BV22DRAFT_538491 [Leucogyrophana mollusca]|uniref:Uncharacterized protein n=1 Tax=Leucogyrophana mollusca TaxID=85980 RepID=A0ACB8BEC8_9AGAM|nr:hypothetical protein BV22DRAFT_538491 [Leucogyrophana mollusca]
MGNPSMDTIGSIEDFSASTGSFSRSFSLSRRPTFVSPPQSHLWRTQDSVCKSAYIAHYSQADHSSENHWQSRVEQSNPCGLVFYNPYLSPPPSSSSSKSTVPLPEEIGEFEPIYSTHAIGVLDSPTVMRREDLSCHKPLTPPPTLPLLTLELPDSDGDVAFEGDEDMMESFGDESTDDECDEQMPSARVEDYSVLPLSPLSPTIGSSHSPIKSSGLGVQPEPPSGNQSSDFFHPLWSPDFLSSKDKDLPMDTSLMNNDDFSPLISPPLQTPSPLFEFDMPRPLLAPLDIPWPCHNTQPDHRIPSSPRGSLLSLNDADEPSPPESPSILHMDLPDIDDDRAPHIIPSSPCRRSCSFLPDSDYEMSDPLEDAYRSSSPSQPLVSLPGADIDDDLLPAAVSAPPFFVPLTPSQPLLLIDDPQDVPLPRSPSPEDFDLGFTPDEISDPELSKLFDLRKRSVAAERAARRVESLVDHSDLFVRAEARKIRKKEKERSKEVGALLRIKLEDRLGSPPPGEGMDVDFRRRRGVISNISQLVAQMVFRRNETCKPISKRKAASGSHDYIKSSLSRSGFADHSETESC